jgi:16S rRNA (uracil1498-N3)-methyltransferase
VNDPSAAHAFVENVAAPQLDDADAHHLMRVLRLRPGERVTVSDGAGAWRACRLGAGGVLEPDGDPVHDPRPVPLITIGFSLVKGDRPEWIVQKLTEVGVDRIVPLLSARSVVRWDAERRPRHLERLRRVAREAAMQSRRTWLPEVTDVVELAAAGGGSATISPAWADPGGHPPSLEWPALFVGPEGGWAADDLPPAAHRVSLGPTILRSETAAVCAGFVLSALRAALIQPGHSPQ